MKNFFNHLYRSVKLGMLTDPCGYHPIFFLVFSLWPYILFLIQVIFSVTLHPFFLLTQVSVTPIFVEFYAYDGFTDDTLLLPRAYFDFEWAQFTRSVDCSVTDDPYTRYRHVGSNVPDWHFRGPVPPIPPAVTSTDWHYLDPEPVLTRVTVPSDFNPPIRIITPTDLNPPAPSSSAIVCGIAFAVLTIAIIVLRNQ